MQEPSNANNQIVPGKTKFKCGTDTMIVVKHSRGTKYLGAVDGDHQNYMPVTFDERYILKYQI